MASMQLRTKNKRKSLNLMSETLEILSRRNMRSKMNRAARNLRRMEEKDD
jgi:hypothetical protein